MTTSTTTTPESVTTQTDLASDGAKNRVFELMLDYQWHRTSEINSAAVGGTEGTRRLRELRAEGWQIVKRTVEGSRQFEYRLVSPAERASL